MIRRPIRIGATGRLEDCVMADLASRAIRMSPLQNRHVLAAWGMVAFGVMSLPLRAQAPVPPAAPSQQPATTMTIEVASIKRNKEVEDQRKSIDPTIPQVPGRAQTLRGGNLVGRGMTVKELIRDAYGFRNRARGEVLGGPGWLDSEVYDIQARFDREFPASTSLGLPPNGEIALRTLLAERFNLKAHLETQTRPVFELVLLRRDGRLGPNLRPSKGGCRSFFQREAVNVGLVPDTPGAGQAEPVPPCLLGVSVGGISTTNMPMSDFVRLLALRPQLNRTVIDRTGLSGGFDIELTYPRSFEPGAPSLLPALKPLLESQMGLTLRDAEGPVEVLVIDSIDHPTEN
jgi:uncharacterized protein (TIGR03435 family)